MKSISPYQPEIRFADIDAMGHVNNAVYFSYFEQTRIHLFSQLIGPGWDWKKQGIIVARNEIDYMHPVFLQDKVFIEVKCTHMGSKSFTLSYEVKRKTSAEDELCAKGLSVLVCFDSETKKTIPVPEIWRETLE